VQILASLDDLFSLLMELKDSLQDCCTTGCCFAGGSGILKMRPWDKILRFCMRMQVTAINGISALKLHVQIDDVQYFLAKLREERESNQDSTLSETLQTHADVVAKQVREDFHRFSRCSQLPLLFCSLFAGRCTLIAVLRTSVFVPTTMTAMLFACDMHIAATLAALFFQASGGALAEDADPRCKPADFGERFGRLLAIGVITVLIGMVPSLVLSQFHQRDFVTAPDSASPEWKHQLRVWRVQDRVIYTFGSLLIAFCIFFNTVFVANVTAKDGLAWEVSVLTSMAQTIVAVPFVMTVMMFAGSLLGRPFSGVQQEASSWCLCDAGDSSAANNGVESRKSISMPRKPPRSKWNSRAKRRQQRASISAEADTDVVGDKRMHAQEDGTNTTAWLATSTDLVQDSANSSPCSTAALVVCSRRSANFFGCSGSQDISESRQTMAL